MRRSGCEPTYSKKNEGVGKNGWILDDDNWGPKAQTSRNETVVSDKRTFEVQALRESKLGCMT